MKKKKVVLALALTAAIAATTSGVSALAHGHGGGCHGRRQAATYDLCDVEDCHTVGLHKHDGTYYCGHYIGDGHDYHETCDVEGCLLTCEHEHDGSVYLPCSDYCGSGTSSRLHRHGRWFH